MYVFSNLCFCAQGIVTRPVDDAYVENRVSQQDTRAEDSFVEEINETFGRRRKNNMIAHR